LDGIDGDGNSMGLSTNNLTEFNWIKEKLIKSVYPGE
jgi:hypothetical protein